MLWWIIKNKDYYNRRGSDWSTSDVTIEMHIAVSYRNLLVPDREDPGTLGQKLLLFHTKKTKLCMICVCACLLKDAVRT